MQIPKTPAQTQDMSQKTGQDLLGFGLNQVAYIRPQRIMDRVVYSVHAADGTPISAAESLALAQELIARQDLENISVH